MLWTKLKLQTFYTQQGFLQFVIGYTLTTVFETYTPIFRSSTFNFTTLLPFIRLMCVHTHATLQKLTAHVWTHIHRTDSNSVVTLNTENLKMVLQLSKHVVSVYPITNCKKPCCAQTVCQYNLKLRARIRLH